MNKQGFQKGHGLLGGGFKGHKHSKASVKAMVAKIKTGYKNGRTPWNKGKVGVMPIGSKHPSWKGGLPKCLDCDKQVSVKTYVRCRTCNNKRMVGELKYNYKGGYENKLMLNRKWRALKLSAEGSHTLKEWEALKNKYQNICLCCKQQEPFIILTEDHVVPLSMGGSDYIENIQPLCQVCNSRKFTAQIDFRINFEEQNYD